MRKGLPLLALTVIAAGCHTDMWVQPRVKVQGTSEFFADGMASRGTVKGTVPRGKAIDDPAWETGYVGGKMVAELPADRAMRELKMKNYAELLKWGRERYEIFCSHCHGAVGDGNGMIAQRGLTLRRPVASYHTERLQKMADGHFYDVINNGYGVMYPLGNKMETADRWAIVAYVRALQRAQAPDATIGGAK